MVVALGPSWPSPSSPPPPPCAAQPDRGPGRGAATGAAGRDPRARGAGRRRRGGRGPATSPSGSGSGPASCASRRSVPSLPVPDITSRRLVAAVPVRRPPWPAPSTRWPTAPGRRGRPTSRPPGGSGPRWWPRPGPADPRRRGPSRRGARPLTDHVDGGATAGGRHRRRPGPRVGPVKRVVIVVVGLVLGLNVVLAALDLAVGSDPGGPSGSTFSTGEDGVAAWAELLEARGVPVTRIRTPLADADLDPPTTLVVVDPPRHRPRAAASPRWPTTWPPGAAWSPWAVRPPTSSSRAVGRDPGWTGAGPTRPRALTLDPGDRRGRRRCSGDGRGSYRHPGGLRAPGRRRRPGRRGGAGRGRGGGRPDPAVEPLPGRGRRRRLRPGPGGRRAGRLRRGRARLRREPGAGGPALLRGSRPAAALLVAALLAMWCAGQRLGPPERTERRLAPPRTAYLDAMVAALSRTSTRRARPPPSRRPRSIPPPLRRTAVSR